MYLHRVWPVICLVAAVLIAWAALPEAGWLYAAAVLCAGSGLAVAAATDRLWSVPIRRRVLIAVIALCVVAMVLSGILFGEALRAVPFLAGIGGAAGLWRSLSQLEQPRARGAGTVEMPST